MPARLSIRLEVGMKLHFKKYDSSRCKNIENLRIGDVTDAKKLLISVEDDE